MMLVAVIAQSVFNPTFDQGTDMTTLASKYIGGRFASTPEDQFYADGVGTAVYDDDGECTYFELEDGSRLKVNADGKIFAA